MEEGWIQRNCHMIHSMSIKQDSKGQKKMVGYSLKLLIKERTKEYWNYAGNIIHFEAHTNEVVWPMSPNKSII